LQQEVKGIWQIGHRVADSESAGGVAVAVKGRQRRARRMLSFDNMAESRNALRRSAREL